MFFREHALPRLQPNRSQNPFRPGADVRRKPAQRFTARRLSAIRHTHCRPSRRTRFAPIERSARASSPIGSTQAVAPLKGVCFPKLAQGALSSISVPRRLHRGGDAGARLDAHGRIDPRPGVASASNLVPKSAISDGDKAKGPALPVAVFGEIPWQ